MRWTTLVACDTFRALNLSCFSEVCSTEDADEAGVLVPVERGLQRPLAQEVVIEEQLRRFLAP